MGASKLRNLVVVLAAAVFVAIGLDDDSQKQVDVYPKPWVEG